MLSFSSNSVEFQGIFRYLTSLLQSQKTTTFFDLHRHQFMQKITKNGMPFLLFLSCKKVKKGPG
ncbi:MAG: hypothetical protein EBU27_07990 [Opitutae bacterium]|nr:hypothetical protein [Opitutae bacterium]